MRAFEKLRIARLLEQTAPEHVTIIKVPLQCIARQHRDQPVWSSARITISKLSATRRQRVNSTKGCRLVSLHASAPKSIPGTRLWLETRPSVRSVVLAVVVPVHLRQRFRAI
jgi:hypothetical protein